MDKALDSTLNAVPPVPCFPLLLGFAVDQRKEIRYLSGQNVIAVLGAKIDALGSRIDMLQKVIWPLIGLLATTVFGLLYRVVMAPPG